MLRLVILFAIAAVALLWVRHRFVPPTFGKLGHYRADAVQANANMPLRHAGRGTCAECHGDEDARLAASFHRALSCEVCHGAAKTHADDPEAHRPDVPRERGKACLYCHEYLASRPTGFPQILERTHNPMQPCIDCHDPHDPTPPEVPGSCAACHAQIARTIAVSHHAKLTCTTCHQTSDEHRLHPRAALPKKPTERQFCGGCHDTGAGSAAAVPRVDLQTHGGSYLCWQCHYPHFPEG